jgi:predicted nucleic acid-binding protein
MILVDTSVWIDHLRRGNSRLAVALELGEVLTHPFVIGEIACGQIKNRRECLELLGALTAAVVASDEEALQFIEEHELMGKGVGYVDVHLLASVALTEDARLWTMDGKLARVAQALAGGF